MFVKSKIKTAFTGGQAVAEAMAQINPDVAAVYPITPQTPIIEFFAKKKADGLVDTEIITVESEHSAMSACIGASALGARTMTASSSQGIMYMLETLPIVSSMRLPIVMAVANRAISGPINIHGDHSDAMMMRDTGWIQLFASSVQEAYDNIFIATKLAENVFLPVTANMDGFVISHSVENLELLDNEKVKDFVGIFRPTKTLSDFKNPLTFGPVTLPNAYFEFRKQIYDAFEKVPGVLREIMKEFSEVSGREYDLVEGYKLEDAQKVIVVMGATCGTVCQVVDNLRAKGKRVGLLKIKMFRPFPYADVFNALSKINKIVVLDKNLVFGSAQVLASEIYRAVGRNIESIVYGLGGREVFEKDIEKFFEGKIKGFLI